MTNDLIERYIYAVTKRLPKKIKQDVSDELRTLIDDMLTERCGELVPEEKDIRVILTELGTPEELYEKYNPDSKKCLIGPPYYSTYKYVLKIVLICTVFGIIVATVISGILNFSQNGGVESTVQSTVTFIVSLVTGPIFGCIFAFGFVTALFAFFCYKDIKIDTTGNFDNLPAVPKKNEKISKTDSITSIVLSIVFLIVFLFVPQIFCVSINEPNKLIPIFNVETVKQTWYIIVMFSVVGIIKNIVKLLEGRYTKRVMITTVIADSASAILSVWWLMNDKIINFEFINNIRNLFDNESEFISNIFSNFQYVFLGFIIFALLLDLIVTVIKCLKYKENKS